MPISSRAMQGEDLTPVDFEEIGVFIEAERRTGGPFEVVKGGATVDAADRRQPEAYRAAGATWWLESFVPWRHTLDAVQQRIRLGPPR